MFKVRETKHFVHIIERDPFNGMYTVKVRSGVTMLHVARFDSGREAWKAFYLSADTFTTRY